MIKVFESFDLATVGHVKSVLEAHGIRTFLKNQYASGALGELPFVEIAPQLFVLDPDDLPEANRVLRELGLHEDSRADLADDDLAEDDPGDDK